MTAKQQAVSNEKGMMENQLNNMTQHYSHVHMRKAAIPNLSLDALTSR